MTGQSKKVLAVIIVVAAVVPMVAGSWTVDNAQFFPKYSSDQASAVVIAHALDRNGKTIAPAWCTEQNDFIKFRYDYDDNQLNVPMVYAGRPYGWYVNDTLTVNQSDDDIRIFANGFCNGISGQGSKLINLSQRGQAVNGDFLVNFDHGIRSSGYWEEATQQFSWNVERTVQFGTEPVNQANISYRIYYLNKTLVSKGGMSSNSYYYGGGTVKNGAGDGNYTADITLPKGAGQYILSVVALNKSYTKVTNPYGGTAKLLTIRPTYLRGIGRLHVPGQRCRMFENLKCEKGTPVEISFNEQYADASYVNVTVRGSKQSSYDDPYAKFNLRQWNSTYWNSSFTIPDDYDGGTYGQQLSFKIHAVHKFVRNGETVKSENTTTRRINVTSFKLLESTAPFVKLGNVLDLVFSPVTPYTENPVPVDTFSSAHIRIVNSTGSTIYDTNIHYPFDGSYDDQNELFDHKFKVPFNASTGVQTAHVTLTNIYNISETKSFTFKVLASDATEKPVVIVAAGGQVNSKNISKTYPVTGEQKEKILLRNLGSTPATVDMSFTGDLLNIVDSTSERTVSIPPSQQHMFIINFTLGESGTYTGNVRFNVGGSTVQPYNLTVPVSIQVQCKYVLDTFCIKSTNLHREVTSAGTYNMSLVVKNTGHFHESFSIDPQGNISNFLGRRQSSYGIDSGNTSSIQLPFTVGTYDSGHYAGSLILATFSSNLMLNSSLDILIDKGQIDASVPNNNLGDFVVGDTIPVRLMINNTGTREIKNVVITSDNLDINAQIPNTISPQDGLAVRVNGTVPAYPDLKKSKEVTSTITVTPDTGNARSVTVSYTAYPDYSREIQSLLQEVNQMQSGLQNKTGDGKSSIGSKLERVSIQLENANQEWTNGRYDSAERKYLEAQTTAREAKAGYNQLESPGGSSSGHKSPLAPFILPMAIILVLFAISGIILYLSIVPDDGVQ